MFFLFFNRPLIGNEERARFDEQLFGTEEFLEFKKKIDILSSFDNEFELAKNEVNETFNIEEKLKEMRIKRIFRK